MRCLYCGEPLSLLRKLTGKAEFCSEAHRVAYQDEFNSLALQRLASQPNQSRRGTASFTPPPAPVAQMEPAVEEPFAGLPFPEDPDDFDLPAQIPEQIPAVESLKATPLVHDSVDEPAPAPLWGLFSDTLPRPAGETPPNYSFPLRLEEYPRRFLMSNGIFNGAGWGTLPDFGYVDLPVPMDDVSSPDLSSAPEPLGLDTAGDWEMPARPMPAPVAHVLSSGTRLVALPVELAELYADTGFAPSICAVALPDYRRQIFPAQHQPLPRQPQSGAPLASLVPGNEIWAYQGDGEAEVSDVSREPWRASVLAGTVAPAAAKALVRELGESTAVRHEFEFASRAANASDIAAVEIPDCESFDAERSLIAPHLKRLLDPSVGVGGWFELGLKLDAGAKSSVSPANVPNALAATGMGRSPVSGQWNGSGFGGSSIPEAGLLELAPVSACELAASAFAAQERLPWVAGRAAVTPHDVQPATGGRLSPVELLPFDLLAIGPVDVPVAEEPQEMLLDALEPAAWLFPAMELPLAAQSSGVRRDTVAPRSKLGKFGVKDFGWPEFAAGCESLFTPDQPFRFHELPFAQRGTTDLRAGDVLGCDMMQGLLLPFTDDRFEGIFHAGLEASVLSEWLDETATKAGVWPTGKLPLPANGPVAPVSQPTVTPSPGPVAPRPVAPRPVEPPASWQQAARAMHEGEQQVPREPETPPIGREAAGEGKPVVAHPMSGFDMIRAPQTAPPVPYLRPYSKNGPVENADQNRSPVNDQPQFEWRREQPQQAPQPVPGQSGSTVTVNTTINVDGNADGVTIESAVRISLGNKKKKEDGLEKFTDGDDLQDCRIQIAPLEDLPPFAADAPELRAMLQPVATLADSIQWPNFSVTPMRRRIAFGPAKTAFFGVGHSPAKTPSAPANPLPPKKGVGFLFKKLTNS